MSRHVFMAFAGDGQLSGLETLIGADDAFASLVAPRYLPSDDAAGRVEVWRDAELVTTVGAAPHSDWSA